jgi:hypothetical protein
VIVNTTRAARNDDASGVAQAFQRGFTGKHLGRYAQVADLPSD